MREYSPHFTSQPPVTESGQPLDVTIGTSLSFRDRLRQSRVGRTMMGLMATASFITATAIFEAAPAHADDSTVEYTVEGTEIGVYARHSPHEDDTDRVPGQGANDGDRVELICGVTNGDAVGERNNHTWHKVLDRTNDQGPFWISDHWVSTRVSWLNSPLKANALVPGEKNCDNMGADNPGSQDIQPAAPVQPFVSYDRDSARNWALAHATDTPPDAGSCTWFVSQAMAKGGFPQTNAWNTGMEGITRNGVRHGTDATRITPDFLSYMRSLPYVRVENLGHMSSDNNDIPDAKPGDVILYDWEGDGSVDHADLVTGASATNPEYPQVSGWSEDGANAVSYEQRGWTWSEEHHAYLQLEKDTQGRYIHFNMSAFLVHIRSEEEVNLGG